MAIESGAGGIPYQAAAAKRLRYMADIYARYGGDGGAGYPRFEQTFALGSTEGPNPGACGPLREKKEGSTMPKAKTSRTKTGYTKADMEAVSDNPEWTKEDFARAKPFSEVCPELHATIKRSRGRPKVDNPKEAVTLRLPPDVVEKFKAAVGDEWRARMAKTLKRAKV